MKISSIQNYNNTNFKSGLTRQILALEKNTSPAKVKAYFKNSPYKDSYRFGKDYFEFKGNKAYALACKMCAKIFIEFRKKHDYRWDYSKNMVFPNGIYVFNSDEFRDKYKDENSHFFSTSGHLDYIMKEDMYIRPDTIMLDKVISNSLENMNSYMDKEYEIKWQSCGHFLHDFIHEWVHAIQGKIMEHVSDIILSADDEKTRAFYHAMEFSDIDNEIIYDVLGEYVATTKKNQSAEIFAEAWTKFISNSLNKECTGFKKDPISELKKTPKEFREILKRASTITPVIWKDYKSRDIVTWDKNWDG